MDLEDRLDEREPSDEPARPDLSRLLRVAAVIPALLLVVVGVRALLDDDDAVHDDGEGILSAQSPVGTFHFARPEGAREFWGTWSLGVLCVDDADRVELTGFRYESTIKPKAAYLGVRTLAPRDVARTPHRLRDRLGTVGAIKGQPLEFESGRRAHRVPGAFEAGVDGVEVTTGCSDRDDFGTREMTEPMQELMLTAKAGPLGSFIEMVEIDYEADGEAHTLRLDWGLGLCGSRVTLCVAT